MVRKLKSNINKKCLKFEIPYGSESDVTKLLSKGFCSSLYLVPKQILGSHQLILKNYLERFINLD